MDEKLKKILQADMEEEAERIIEEVNADPTLKDVEVPEGMREKLFAKIRAYEEQKALGELSDENKELIRLGKKYKKRRKIIRCATFVFVIVAVLAMGIVSIGEDKNIFGMISRLFSGGDQDMINSENIEPILCVEEEEVYEKIEDLYGFKPVALQYLPKGIVFQEAVFGLDIQGVNMYYGTNDEASIIYIIRPNYRKASFGTVIEDVKRREYQLDINNVLITICEYEIEQSGESRWSVSFSYQDVQYLLRITDMEQKEVEKIVNDLHFLEK